LARELEAAKIELRMERSARRAAEQSQRIGRQRASRIVNINGQATFFGGEQ